MPEKRRMSEKDKTKILKRVSDFISVMKYNADFRDKNAKELNRQIWMTSENLGLKQCGELLYLLFIADSGTLLSFTVSLGRLVWRSYLRAKRKILERKHMEKMKQREKGRQKHQRRGKPGLVAMKGRGGNPGSLWVRLRFRMRPVFRSRVLGHRTVNHHSVEVGSRLHRLTIAMFYLSFRNVCVMSEWEFWTVCLVKQVFGFWGSIAIGGELDGTFTCIATKFGFHVVSCDCLERLQSYLWCSSTARYQGSRR